MLDTAPEPVYDDVTRLLASICEVPIALVSLVDAERQWFKSRHGLQASETPRDLAFCAHAILGDDLFVVPDATADARFADNALVTGEPRVRFYAGAPILTADGHALGTVCVIDHRPRELTLAQRDALLAMARQVAGHLELRRQVHELEAVQRQLARTSERLDLVVAASCDGIWDLELESESIQLSARAFEMLGLPCTSGRLPLPMVWSIVHEDDRRSVRRAIVRHLATQEPFELELRCRHLVTGPRWFRLRAVADPVAGGRARRMVGSLTDVHSQLIANDQLQRASRLLAESQALARVGGWELDLATQQLYWTAETYRIHETSPSAYQPSVATALNFYSAESQPKIRAALEDATRRGRAFSLDLELVTARGRRVWCRATGGTVFVGGKAVRVSGAFQDITAQRRLDAELLQAKEAAEAASRAKSAFLATMSHEIRTPMHTVLGYTDMLRASSLDDEQRECVDVITSSGNSLLRLIDDILDFSKVEAGKMQLDRVAFDLRETLATVSRMLQPQAHRKGVDVRVERLPADDLIAFADPQRVHQVLVNLVGNAVKFTANGEVVISVEVDGHRLCVRVQDSGIGISREQQRRLFEDFMQVDSSTQRKFGGTGLGLAISKRLIRAMGGNVGVDSEPGAGSTFWFTLPLAARHAADTTGEADSTAGTGSSSGDAGMHGNRVLVVDDNRLNLRLAVRILEGFGLEVDSADDGARASSMACTRDYDLILMDCLMPGMDGFEATRVIRDHEGRGSRRTPIIALTANALPEDRQVCLDAGMDDFVSKPFTRKTLAETLRRWLVRGAAVLG